MLKNKKIKYSVRDLEKDLKGLSFGNMLESYRLAHEFSQKDLATELGISPSSLCDLEKGRKIPTISRAVSIARLLGASEKQWIQTAIQDQLNREHLELEVSLKDVH